MVTRMKFVNEYFASVVAIFLAGNVALAQYAPGVGNPGTTAIYKDSSVFVGWATQCQVVRGYQDISNTSLGYASVGDSSMALGVAGSNAIVSLGDGGMATMTFADPIGNGPGWDFAVFENSFDDSFLELAFVEVSSDGINFFRFPAHSLTDTTVQTGSFGSTDPAKINNLAGKYRAMYGTPFDLAEMMNIQGLDIQQVTHVRVIDVVGSINPQYCTRDTANNPVNDPWPTGFASSGFDLDAVGVIHENPESVNEVVSLITAIFPNPSGSGTEVSFQFNEYAIGKTLSIVSCSGTIVYSKVISSSTEFIPAYAMKPGLYFVMIEGEQTDKALKWVISE